jgi:phage terminase large subunit-like protein
MTALLEPSQTDAFLDSIQRLPPKHRQAIVRRLHWLKTARPEQLPPDGDWQIWYLRGGRGAGKTRTGAETLAWWITSSDPLPTDHGEPVVSEWGIVAPFKNDASSVCAEGPSGILRVLGPLVKDWNRSEKRITVHGNHVIHLDGANDGGERIQGHNLRGAWCDEVGLWDRSHWDRAWNESIRQAVRHQPAKIVATGTPKMGHPLIAHLLASSRVVHTHMRTIDNIANLHEATIEGLYEEYGGTTLGRQELDGEFIAALDGEILPRRAWRWFDCRSMPADDHAIAQLPRFDRIVYSWDTAVKGKTSNDPVAGQAWGVHGPNRYLLRLFHARASFEATIVAMKEMRAWGLEKFPTAKHEVLIEVMANGRDAIDTLRRSIDGVHDYNPRDGGDKVRRALTASPALETGHCYLPGFGDPDPTGLGYSSDTPGEVQGFVEECSLFSGDMKHAHDDQVDAWSQMVNWTRIPGGKGAAALGRPKGRVPRPGGLAASAGRH